ncbi:serine hydrolase domain-containing protein [Tahibacter soli]|uniref:Serine hydrolase n=1 Tax=Tahibacter soli TaxID=2983605 RepID=A0A9X4BIV1_9GAMM|nr:serine hydrolase domain-containing protein [Tahibacter soli]MDC8013993.1 serine hydrolase [Tahibacter soli]
MPRLLSALFAVLVAVASPAATPSLDAAALRTALDAAVVGARDQGYSGTLLVAQNGKTLYQAFVGKADRERGVDVAADTRFGLASTGKLFTTVSVLQLVEADKLDLDATVGRYLPDWPQADVRDKVTLRHLLTHASGLGSYFNAPGYRDKRAQLLSVADHLPLFANEAPAFAPGSGFAYSNSGFMLLGRIVEVVSGEDYYDYVAKHVFAPAGMRDTGYYGRDGKADKVAVGYLAPTGSETNDGWREWRGGPAGGGWSTPADLLRFHDALMRGKLIGEAARARWLTPLATPGEGGLRGSGLGALVLAAGDDVVYGHPGGSPGTASEFWASRDSGLVVVLMSNMAPAGRGDTPPLAMTVARQVFDAVVAAGGPRFGPPPRKRP